MWSCEIVTSENNEMRFEYLTENSDLETNYTQEDVERLFKASTMDIYREDQALDSLYSPRIALFTPKESGTYIIRVAGYYHSTSPSEITSLEVVVHEKN